MKVKDWNDLTNEQAMKVHAALTFPHKDVLEVRYNVAHIVSGQHFMPFSEDTIATDLERWLERWTSPFFTANMDEDGNTAYAPKLGFTRNPYPVIEATDEQYSAYGPSDGLTNISIYELGFIWQLIDVFVKSGDEEDLHKILAVAWRPSRKETEEELASGWHGDRRRPLLKEESTISERAIKMRTVPPLAKQLMYLYLLSCREQIIANYPILFDNSPEEGEKGKDYGWAGLLLTVADGVKDLDLVSSQSWQNVFIYLAKMEDDRRLAALRNPTA